MATARSVLLALLVAAALDASAAMLVSFEGHQQPQQLAAACKGAEAAAAAVQDNGVGAAAAALEQVLGAAEADGGRWLSHVDAGHVVISLIRGGEPLLGWVRILAGGQGDGPQTLFATDEGGTHVLGGSALEALAGASAHANVFSLPATGLWCPQLDECLEHLEETGLGMPIEYTRRDGVSCCEGLVDVLVARADFSLAPPALFLPHQPTPPPAVLAAFHLLLYEAGGSLTVSGSAREARSYRQRMGREHPLQTGGGLSTLARQRLWRGNGPRPPCRQPRSCLCHTARERPSDRACVECAALRLCCGCAPRCVWPAQDVYGEALDLSGALSSGGGEALGGGEASGGGESECASSLMRRGVLGASAEAMVPYMVRAIKTAFPADELDGSRRLPPSLLDGTLLQRTQGWRTESEFTVVMVGDCADDRAGDLGGDLGGGEAGVIQEEEEDY